LRAGRSTGLAIALTTAVAASIAVSAHRRDEYLQAARLAVEPNRVELELDLTPGIAVADATIADLDRDRDGMLSEGEKRAYVGRVLDAVVLELDGRSLHVETTGSTFPGLNDFRRGEGTIQLLAAAVFPDQADGDHRVSFRNRNDRDGSVYLANALVPRSDRIVITTQRRDPAQRDLTIDYVLRRGPSAPAPTWLLGGITGVAVLAALLMRSRCERPPDCQM
jgi:hypothetical protein